MNIRSIALTLLFILSGTSLVAMHYETLGIAKTATQEEIKSAYKKMALKHHPDRNPENEKAATEVMKKVNEAYEVLGDPIKRKNYDNPSPFYFPGSSANAANNNPFSGGFHYNAPLTKCHRCNQQTNVLEQRYSPCCFHLFHLCNNCVTHLAANKKGMKCPHCPHIITMERNQSGFVHLKKTSRCNGFACSKLTKKQHNNPCCYGSIALCEKCSTKAHVPCPSCNKKIKIESKGGSIHLKKTTKHYDKNTDKQKPIPASNLTGKAAMMTVLCCASVWVKYSLRNELDTIKQYAQKLMQERSSSATRHVSEPSPVIRDQFDISGLTEKLTFYTPETTELEDAINDFDKIVIAKNSNKQRIDACFKALNDTIDDYKNHIGSPVKNLLGTSIALCGTIFLFLSSYVHTEKT